MSLLDNLRNSMTKFVLNSPARELISEKIAILSFTDPHSAKILSFPVQYERKEHTILAVCPKKNSCWKKFDHGSPVKITMKDREYSGWAEVLDPKDPADWSILLHSDLITAYLPEDHAIDAVTGEEISQALSGIVILKISLS